MQFSTPEFGIGFTYLRNWQTMPSPPMKSAFWLGVGTRTYTTGIAVELLK